MKIIQNICGDLGVPLADEKWIGPVKLITYLGLEIDAENYTIRVPYEKIN